MSEHNADPDGAVPQRMTSGDLGLLTGPYMELTPGTIEQMRAGIEAHERRYKEAFPALVEACPYETRLAVACWVMRHVYAHATEGGTYRYLIYHRLGFGPDAYAPLMFADALNVSNEFIVTEPSGADAATIKALKDAYDALPHGAQRQAVLSALFRVEELIAHVRASSEIIRRQRSELIGEALEKPSP